MTTLLLISESSAAAEKHQALLAARFRVSWRSDSAAAQAAAATGVFDLIVRLAEAVTPSLLNELGSLRAACPAALVLVPTDCSRSDEAEAYGAGCDLVARSPLLGEPLLNLLERLGARAEAAAPSLASPAAAVPAPTGQPLAVLRDFSRVFAYSLEHKRLVEQFLHKLRDVISVTRIAIFLETPPPAFPTRAAEPGRLPCAGAIGLPQDLIECFEFSREAGLGRHLTQTPQIVRRENGSLPPFLQPDSKAQRELNVLGCEVALPITDRERTLGIAVLGGRITGAPFRDDELELIYHLLEELGIAIRNSRLHEQVSRSRQLFVEVLESMGNGSLVVGPDLSIVYANRAFIRYLRGTEAPGPRLDFAELPAQVAAAVHRVVEQAEESPPFLFQRDHSPRQIFRVSILPLADSSRPAPRSALVLLEDFTPIEAAKQAELEASNFRLISLIAKRFSHEIRNSLVPLTTHHQLLDAEYETPEFRRSLKEALGTETTRIHRFTEQMLFLAQAQVPPAEIGPLSGLLRQGFAAAEAQLGKPGSLQIESGGTDPMIRYHKPSLLLAFQEIFINGLQSSAEPAISVRIAPGQAEEGKLRAMLFIRDNGRGFSPESAERALEPFFTTRNTGVGLGLTVARKIVEEHGGSIEIRDRSRDPGSDVLLSLPVEP